MGVFFLELFITVGGSLGWAEVARMLGTLTGFTAAAFYQLKEKYFHSLSVVPPNRLPVMLVLITKKKFF